MARAKRTERAEARRRYRAAVAEGTIEEGAEPIVAPPHRAGTARTPATPATPTARVGIVEAFRRAAGPADVRADLAALPWLVRHTRAVWLPAVVVAVATVLMAMPGGTSNPWFVLAGQALVYPPPMATSFLAGILAPRGSWLAGAIAGVFSAIGFTVLVLGGLIPVGAGAGGAGVLIGYAFVSSITFGAAVGAFAGFYRRFLALSNPNRGRRQAGRPQRGRSTARRR